VRRSDYVYLTIIVAIALAIRVWAPWSDVFGSARVDFLETDAWYHVRLLENQVRNFPHHVTIDPYAAPQGQYVPVAPLLDTIIATVVYVTKGSHAPTAYIERVAALAPPLMGIGAVLAVWMLGARAFGRREGLIAAFLVSFYPGHFLDRSLVGFVDHHALEAWLAFAVLASFAGLPTSIQLPTKSNFPTNTLLPTLSGVLIALYLLAWTSGALLVAILAVWVVTLPLVASPEDSARAARSTAIAAAVALVGILLFQDHGMYRYSMQVFSLVILLAVSGAITLVVPRFSGPSSALKALAVLAGLGLVLYGVAFLAWPGVVVQSTNDLLRLTPDPTRMTVMEARPLFWYTGNRSWSQPWLFFRSGFYVGAVATILLAMHVRTSRRADHWLIVLFTAAMFAATVGQNRFGYYLVPATTVVIGWLAARVLDWGGVPHADNPAPKPSKRAWPFQRELAVMLVAGVAVAPNIVPAVITTTRTGGMPSFWFDVMQWLRTETEPPFSSDDYYYARYAAPLQEPKYTVLNWWDQGYWIMQTAHRVPVSNPTQAAAGVAASILLLSDDQELQKALATTRARYIVVDWELPFREISGGNTLGGRFENLVTWAGRQTSEFYSTCFVMSPQGWQPQWVFREPYYQSLVYRLMVLGGVPAAPTNNSWVAKLDTRVDSTGRQFCELSERQRYATVEEAKTAAAQKGAGYQVVGMTAWQPAFNVPPVQGLRLVKDFRRPGQAPTEAPFARVFETYRR
jgi:dolichyl-diphosphooligosaccharide--protein glycosyltransferase